MDLLEIMKRRRSVRQYTEEAIPKESIEKILQAGLLSASGKNARPWEFIVVQEKENLKYLSECRVGSAKMLEKANCAIIVLADSEKTPIWIEDASIAMTNMHLMADYLGVGSCWIQGRGRMASDDITSTEDYLRNKFLFPQQYKLEAILSLGIAANHPIPRRLEDLELEKIHYETF